MNISRILGEFSSRHVALTIVVCALISAWAMIIELKPQVQYFMDKIESSYDSLIPEITIKDGKASIKEKQPHYLSSSSDREMTLVIDTREKKQREAYEHIKETPYGVALSSDFVVLKNQDQLSEMSLKNFPDMVINSTTLLEVLNEYSFKLWLLAWFVFIIYFLIAKSAQVFIFALIPILLSRRLNCELSFTEATKFSAASMILPVIVVFLLKSLSLLSSVESIIYFGLFVIILVRITREHIKASLENPPLLN